MAQYNVAPLENLVEQFEKMPGIGHKTAQRLAYYVLNLSKTQADQLANAVLDAHSKIHYCKKCCNLTDKELCPICENPSRDNSVICVVETPRDATAVENTHEYKGVYHVLHGAISPLNDVGPDNLTIKQLVARLSDDTVKEVIMATNPTATLNMPMSTHLQRPWKAGTKSDEFTKNNCTKQKGTPRLLY